mgnify:FL=1
MNANVDEFYAELIKTIKVYRVSCPNCGNKTEVEVIHREGEPNCTAWFDCECGFTDHMFYGQET